MGLPVHSCLDYVLQALSRFPGEGREVIELSLKSPVVRNRNMAIKALNGWDGGLVSGDVINGVRLALSDPDEMVSIGAENLLRKWGV